MKNTGVCPKCDSNDVEENYLGGMNAMWAGRIYRCKECGFSEIWSTKSHRSQLNVVIALAVVLPVIMFALAFWVMP